MINFKTLSEEFKNVLNNHDIKSKNFRREKTPFSIWRKIQKKNILEQITDIIGFRVIVNNISDCYKALGAFTQHGIAYPEGLKIIYPLQK